MDISSRFPSKKEIAPVYAVIVLLVYGWTVIKFNYNLPGWLYFLNLGEILSVLSYSMVVNLLESLLALLGVILIGAVLPRKWFLDAFISRAANLSAMFLGLLMYIASQFATKEYYPSQIIHWLLPIFCLIGFISYIVGRIHFVRNAIEFFADRAIIFLYISIPVSLVSLVAVLIRNII